MCTLSVYIFVLDHIENKHSWYRRKDFMKKVCEYLKKKLAKNITDKKKTLQLTKKELKLHQDTIEHHIFRKRFIEKVCKR